MTIQHDSAPTGQGQGAKATHHKFSPKFSANPVETFKTAHGGRFTPSGKGERANCPACDDRKGTLSITEADNKLLIYCFKGCTAEAVLASVGLTFADIMPPRHWPASPEERRVARRAIREAGWASALAVLALEARVVLLAARKVARWQALSEEDDARAALALQRVEAAAAVLVEAATWRPA